MLAHTSFQERLLGLPYSYEGAQRVLSAPYSLVGLGEGILAAKLLHERFPQSSQGTYFVLSSAEQQQLTQMVSDVATHQGQTPFIISVDKEIEPHILIPDGVFSTYHFVQAVLYATDHADEAKQNDILLEQIATLCHPDKEENPARTLAWQIWNRVPVLLQADGEEWLGVVWQAVLARVAKVPSWPIMGDTLATVSSLFEARHEFGDQRLALLLGELDPTLQIAHEILQTRVDDVLHIPFPIPEQATPLSMWYFGLWVAYYLAERYEQSPSDHAVYKEAKQSLCMIGDGLKA